MRHAIAAVALLFLISACAVWVAADTVPTDPIIGVKGGGGSIEFFGTATIDLTSSTDVTGDCFSSSGCFTNVFSNDTNTTITSFLESYDLAQTGEPPFTVADGSYFQGINILDSQNVILYSTSPSTNCIGPYSPIELYAAVSSCSFTEFSLTFANVTPGTEFMTFTSNPVPEPSTIALLLSGVGMLGIGRKKWWGKRA